MIEVTFAVVRTPGLNFRYARTHRLDQNGTDDRYREGFRMPAGRDLVPGIRGPRNAV